MITLLNINPCHLGHHICTELPFFCIGKAPCSDDDQSKFVGMIPAQEWAAATTRERCLPLPEVIVNFISAHPLFSFVSIYHHSFPLFQYITPFLCFTISALFFFVSLPHATFPLFHNNINLFFCFKLSLDCKFSLIRCHLSEYSSSFYIMILADGNILNYQLSLSNCPPPPQ